MRLVFFFFVNVLVAALCGLLTFLQGHSAFTIILRVVAVLVSLQLAYVLWLFAISLLPPKKIDEKASDSVGKPSDNVGTESTKMPETR